jgi:hypothetical protein
MRIVEVIVDLKRGEVVDMEVEEYHKQFSSKPTVHTDTEGGRWMT